MSVDTRPLMVTIQCTTYNHEPYIRQCLEGFVMQKTNFRFEAIVHDDASIDGTAAIVKEFADKYPEIIKPIFETENQYSKRDGSLSRILDEYTLGKYISICEGDDYWIDPLKLQKQVDFLEKHPKFSACLTKFISYNEVTKKPYALVGDDYSSLRDMLWRDLQFGTATLVFRRSLYNKYRNEICPEKQDWLMGDKPLVLYMASQGEVKTLCDCTTVYRILENSVSHSNSAELQLKRARNTIDIYHFFAEKYLSEDIVLKDKIEGAYLYRAFQTFRKCNLPFPEELKTEILSYKGRYNKIYIVKLLLHFPFLQGVTYRIVEMKNRMRVRRIQVFREDVIQQRTKDA